MPGIMTQWHIGIEGESLKRLKAKSQYQSFYGLKRIGLSQGRRPENELALTDVVPFEPLFTMESIMNLI